VLVHPALDAAALTLPKRVSVRRLEYWDIWLRDTGPLFVNTAEGCCAVDFGFNGWGKKFHHREDDGVAKAIAKISGIAVESCSLITEGGALDCNGAGVALATRHSILNDNRNPGLSEADAEALLRAALGVEMLWLDRGLAGDHTDSHVDNIARFVAEDAVVCMRAASPSAVNYDVLEEIFENLSTASLPDGRRLRVETLPCPEFFDSRGEPVAASYCNFLIGTKTIIVPTFEVPSDQEALEELQRLFPERRVVGMDARDLLLAGGGAFHCISQEQACPPSK
jgi:agmatine deiminase